MAVGAIEDKFYQELAARLALSVGVGERDDPACWPALRAELRAVFRQRTQAEWTREFAGSDACVSPVASMTQAPAHPHLAARHTFVPVDGVMMPAPAPRVSPTPPPPAGPPPRIGQDTLRTLRAW